MRYHEIMESSGNNSSLANTILDMLTPLASNGVEHITIDQLINKVKKIPTGLYIDRELIMDVLDPNQFPLIKSIEGDKVFLNQPTAPERSVSDKQKKTEQDKIKASAEDQAVKAVTDSGL